MTYNIFVVDDEAKICEIMTDFLTDNGFNVQSAQNAEDALKILDTEKFDLLILDKNIAGTDGMVIFRYIRKKGIDIPVIAVTSSRRISEEEEEEESGFADLLFKPVDLNELLESVNKALGISVEQ